jgi:type II secretion system protein N
VTAAASRAPGLPRWLRWLGPPFAALVLVAFFVFLGFPWERVRDAVARAASAALGAEVRLAELRPALSLGGPAVAARGVSVAPPGGPTWRLDEVSLRPAWSLAWLRGRPALATDVRAPQGRLAGTFELGGEPGFDGRLEGVALAELPLGDALPDLTLDGVADADVDVRATESGPTGSVRLAARDGSLALPGMPLALPYASLAADVELGGDAVARLSRVALDGPMVALEGSGSVARGPSLADSPLDFELRVEVREPGARPAVESLGIRVGRDGKGSVRVRGSLGAPEVR